MRWRVDLAIASKMAASSTPSSSGRVTRWRDGWISSIGRNPAARMDVPIARLAGRHLRIGRHDVHAVRGQGLAHRDLTIGEGARRHAGARNGPAREVRAAPGTHGQRRVSASTRPPSSVTRNRGDQPDARRCSAQALDW